MKKITVLLLKACVIQSVHFLNLPRLLLSEERECIYTESDSPGVTSISDHDSRSLQSGKALRVPAIRS